MAIVSFTGSDGVQRFADDRSNAYLEHLKGQANAPVDDKVDDGPAEKSAPAPKPKTGPVVKIATAGSAEG